MGLVILRFKTDMENNCMSERVDEFRIIDSTENIFDLEGEYVIPLY